ncbi:tyrosine-type recombinase/integrase [Litorivicinus sp.]|nr:tyrosine-type recombinase/integrase [Litorivicinus sp.]
MGRTFSSAVPYTYLKRGVYYFVRRIPSDLHGFYRSDRVIISLRTKSLHRASNASQRLSSRLDDYWLDLRLKQTDVPGSHLLKIQSPQTHGTTVTLGATLSHASELYQRTKGKGRGKLFFTHTDRAVWYAIQCLGNKDLGEYTTIDAGEFRDWLFAKDLKRSSVSRNLTIVKAVVNLCIQEEGLGINNPFAKVYIPSDENHTKRHSLTIEQTKLLQQRCREQDDSLRWLAALISDTGMRLAEAVGLAKDDLKLTDEVPHFVIRKHPWRPLKTKGSERIIPLVGAALWASQRLSDTVSGQFLFPQYVDGTSTNANSASAALNKWMKTFLPRECVVHGMRHAFRDRLRAVNAPMDMIDQLGGWQNGHTGTNYGAGYSLTNTLQLLTGINLD